MSSGLVSDEMLDHYWEHGYTIARKLFDSRSVETLLERFAGIVGGIRIQRLRLGPGTPVVLGPRDEHIAVRAENAADIL